ncbi:MAG: hypothetical protein RML40_01585 [Bacteroidota bacterium]|nr:VOC family protein [Candidatus Kapabacteria bacterium]MDW8219200.1 hypothetical protein [Bacteroidota bacterium]
MAWTLHNLREIVKSIGTPALPREQAVWRDMFGWTTHYEGQLTQQQLHCWHLEPPVQGYEVLYGFPSALHGLLRLVCFTQCSQQIIRAGAQIWDTGGIFDFDLRVSSMNATYNALIDAGWYVFGEPRELRVGPFVLNEALLFSPEAAGVALVDRIEPPLSKENAHNGLLGSIYLSVTVAQDINATARFLIDVLGFTPMERFILQPSVPEPTVFRLPWNIAPQIPVHLAAFSPNGRRDTLIEVLQFEGLHGEDRSERAIPPHRGLLMYRFPVSGIEEYYRHVAACWIVTTPLTTVEIAPYGQTQVFAVRSPDGVWFEFFEESHPFAIP